MINLSILISSSEVSGPGGLFDINATLPLVAIQFILLMVILNIILYSPLLTIIEERKEYILSHLAEASEKLAQAKELTTQYEQDLETARKEAQLEIANSQNIHKEILDIELDIGSSSTSGPVDKRPKIEQPPGIHLESTDTRPIKATKLALDTIRANEITIENSETGKVTAVVALLKVFGDNTQDWANTDYYAYLLGQRTFANPEAVNINVFVTPGFCCHADRRCANTHMFAGVV